MSKTEKFVTTPARKASRYKVVKYTCDFCDADCTDQVKCNRGTCGLCKRNVCRKHSHYDPHDPSDSPSRYCPPCYDIKYVRYGDRQAELDERHWKEEDALDEAVKKESLAGLLLQGDK